MTTLVNLTRLPLTLISPDGTQTVVNPSGFVAQVTRIPGGCEMYESMPCPVSTPTIFGKIVGVPDPIPGTVFLVSCEVGCAMRNLNLNRSDVMMPGIRWGLETVPEMRNPHTVGVTHLLRVF